MSKTDVLALVDLISNNQADATVTPQLYVEVVEDWGHQDFLSTFLQFSIAATEEIQLPSTLLHLIGLAYNSTMLSPLNLRELESLDHNWRNTKGNPVAFSTDEVPAKTIALWPTPVQPSNPPDFVVTSIHSEVRTDVPVYWELPLALLVLEREFIRESNHRDSDFGTLCGNFGRMLLGLVA